MLIDARVAALIVAAICFCGCGTTANKNTPMSAKDEARYAAAIEASAGQGYQIIEDGEMLTMDTETGKLIVRPAPKSTTTNHNADKSSNDQNNADKTNDQNNADKSSGDKLTRDTLAKMTTHDGGRTFDVDESTYNEFFDQSPATVLARLSLEPIQDGTSLLGYRITHIANPFENVDLKPGDIVVGLDGKIPKTPDAYFEAWQKAKSTGTAIVNIQRDLERYELRWQVR